MQMRTLAPIAFCATLNDLPPLRVLFLWTFCSHLHGKMESALYARILHIYERRKRCQR